MRKRVVGTCSLCQKKKELCASHAVPNGFLRQMRTNGGGQAIHVSTGTGKTCRTNDSGAYHLLCHCCEAYCNDRFDTLGQRMIRKLRCRIASGSRFIEISEVDPLALFLLSVVWRASISPSHMYTSFRLSRGSNMQLRNALLNQSIDPLKLASLQIENLVDPETDGFSASLLKDEFVILPASFTGQKRYGGRMYVYIACVIHGFVFHVCMPPLPPAERNRPGFFKRSRESMFVPDQNLLDVPVIAKLLVHAMDKHERGHEKLGQGLG